MDDLKKFIISLSLQMNILDCKIESLKQAIELNMTAFYDNSSNTKVREWFKELRNATEKGCNNVKTEYKKLYPEVFGDDNGGSEL